MHDIIDTSRDCKLLHSVQTKEESSLVVLRSKLFAAANRLHAPDLKRENMMLVAAELATNNIKHAGGRGMIQVWQQPGSVLDIVSLDYGPGIADLELAERDGYSSMNTFGKGLGAIRRLSDASHVYTQPHAGGLVTKWTGTLFLARFYLRDQTDPGLENALGLFSRSLSDHRHNGDRIYLQKKDDRLRWLHLDGLGHGEEAQRATANLSQHVGHPGGLSEILQGVDKQLVSTRGAVGVAAELSLKKRHLQMMGVGDMHAHVYENDELNRYSFVPGVLGREHRTMEAHYTSLAKRSLVMTASDGIRRNWDVGSFAGLFNQHPQLIAYALGNIMGRVSDDQSLCVAVAG